MNSEKQKLRQEILDRLKRITKEYSRSKSLQLIKILNACPFFFQADCIMFYVSFKDEVYTRDLIRELLGQKRILIPRMTCDDHSIEATELTDWSQLKPNMHGILEVPDVAPISDYENIQLVLIPGIVFDKSGNRLGRGFGYYDRFLKQVPGAIKVALAFDDQLADSVPTDVHDVSVDYIVTDKIVVDCLKERGAY